MAVTNELLYEVLKDVQERVKRLENLQREGFASLRSNISALHSDQTITLRRLDGTETNIDP